MVDCVMAIVTGGAWPFISYSAALRSRPSIQTPGCESLEQGAWAWGWRGGGERLLVIANFFLFVFSCVLVPN